MSNTWILVANASRAQLFEVNKLKLFNLNTSKHKESYLHCIKTFDEQKSRMKNAELVTDKFGSHTAGRANQGAYDGAMLPKEIEAERFAKMLSLKLEEGRVQHKFDDLIIIAPAQFRGMLLKHFCPMLKKQLSQSIGKDYTLLPDKALTTQLISYL